MCPIYLCVVGPLAVLMQVPKATDKTCSGARTDGTDAVSYRPLCYRSARSDTYAVPSVYRNDLQRLGDPRRQRHAHSARILQVSAVLQVCPQ